MFPPNPEDVIQAAAMTPAFLGAYANAPEQVTLNGKTYARDGARNAQERVWYLAAVSCVNPRAVHNLAYLGVDDLARGFDESSVTIDPDVVSAQADVDDKKAAAAAAQTKLAAARAGLAKTQREAGAITRKLTQARAEVEMRQQQMDTLFNNFGDALATVFTGGISKSVQKVDQQIRLDGAKGAVTALEQQLAAVDLDGAQQEKKSAEQDLAAAQAGETAARSALKKAQDAVRKRLRAADDAQAKKDAKDAADTKASQDAADRKARADSSANAATDYASSEYAGEEDVQWQSQDFATTDPDADLGVPDQLDMEEQADLWGDEDYAAAMAEATDEPMIGVNTVISPYSWDRYYEGYFQQLPDDHAWGADTTEVVTGIVAGVLAAAPAILKAVAPPPSKDDKASDSSTTVDTDGWLAKVGLKKTINDAAAAAGGAAGDKGGAKASDTLDKWLWGGVIVGAALLAAKVL